jgi:hypothetical protein
VLRVVSLSPGKIACACAGIELSHNWPTDQTAQRYNSCTVTVVLTVAVRWHVK